MSLEGAGAPWEVDLAEESGTCAEYGGPAAAAKNDGAVAECSDVASGATPAEIIEAVGDAIAAIEGGDIEIAKARLRAILTAANSPVSRGKD